MLNKPQLQNKMQNKTISMFNSPMRVKGGTGDILTRKVSTKPPLSNQKALAPKVVPPRNIDKPPARFNAQDVADPYAYFTINRGSSVRT